MGAVFDINKNDAVRVVVQPGANALQLLRVTVLCRIDGAAVAVAKHGFTAIHMHIQVHIADTQVHHPDQRQALVVPGVTAVVPGIVGAQNLHPVDGGVQCQSVLVVDALAEISTVGQAGEAKQGSHEAAEQ